MGRPAWEYVQETCEVWQIGHLCNHMARHGWEPVAVFDSEMPGGWSVPAEVGDEAGTTFHAKRPYSVLFRRSADYDDETR